MVISASSSLMLPSPSWAGESRRAPEGSKEGNKMIGDRLASVQIEWRDWVGGRSGTNAPRTCIGTVEHVGQGWVLIRRPRGGLRLKRLAHETVLCGRISARREPGGENLLLAWLADDEAHKGARRELFRAAAQRHATERAAADKAEATKRAAAEANGDDWIPF